MIFMKYKYPSFALVTVDVNALVKPVVRGHLSFPPGSGESCRLSEGSYGTLQRGRCPPPLEHMSLHAGGRPITALLLSPWTQCWWGAARTPGPGPLKTPWRAAVRAEIPARRTEREAQTCREQIPMRAGNDLRREEQTRFSLWHAKWRWSVFCSYDSCCCGSQLSWWPLPSFLKLQDTFWIKNMSIS